MPVEVYMPRLGLSMQEGTILKWLKNEGDPVNKGDEVVEIESEKITNIVEAAGTGVLGKILYSQGVTVPSGTVIAYIREAGDAEETLAPAGSGGESMESVQAPADSGRKFMDSVHTSEASVHVPEAGGRDPLDSLPDLEIRETIPLSGTRKLIADRMAESLRRSPQATVTTRVDMSGLSALKEEHASAGLKYSYTDYMVKIISLALQENPALNASVQDGNILIYRPVNIGIAVAAGNSLTVPVIKDVQNKGLPEISEEVRSLTRKARDGKLTAGELQGGTFTFSNMGMFHVDVMTPILNPPEAALLALGTARKEVVVNETDDSWQIKPVAALSLTVDHAAVDGMPAARFLETVSGIIADPKPYFERRRQSATS